MVVFKSGYQARTTVVWVALIALMLLLDVICSVSATATASATVTESLQRNNLRGNSTRADELSRLDRRPRIINGRAVDRLRFPYFSLMYGNSLCGAVLIAPRIALGAAHCETASDRLRIGAFKDVRDGQSIKIRSTIAHPNYDVKEFDNDIILFLLDEESTHPPIQLKRDRIDGGSFTVIGFGDTDKGDKMDLADELMEVELGYVDNDTCDDGHGGKGEVMEDMMCAAGDDKDSCIGDSGGPLIMKGNSIEEDRLVGVVSWGRGCADDGVPGVYSRISYFYDWIVETVCEEFPSEAPDYMQCTTNEYLEWILRGRDDATRKPGTMVPVLTADPTGKPSGTPTLQYSEHPTTTEPTDRSSEYPSLEPTRSPNPSLSEPPTVAHSFAPTITVAPSAIATEIETLEPTRPKPMLLFVSWAPPFKLKECYGDCDEDDDCEGNLVCFGRDRESDTFEVPGCTHPENFFPKNVDICVDPALLP